MASSPSTGSVTLSSGRSAAGDRISQFATPSTPNTRLVIWALGRGLPSRSPLNHARSASSTAPATAAKSRPSAAHSFSDRSTVSTAGASTLTSTAISRT